MTRPFSDSSPRIPPIHRCFCLLCHEKRSLLLRVYATVQINANITTYPLCKQLFLFASQDYAHNMSYIPLQLLWQVSRILTPMPSGWAISLTGSASIASTTGKLLLELYQSHASLRDVSRFQIGWIFGKVQNGLWPPSLIFGKLHCAFRDKIGTKVHMFIWRHCCVLYDPISHEMHVQHGNWLKTYPKKTLLYHFHAEKALFKGPNFAI